MSSILQDVRYGLRMLAKSPGFTAVAVLALALGIGANTAIFSLIDAVLLRSIPVHDPSHLMLLNWTAHKEPKYHGFSSFGDCPGGTKGQANPSGCSFPVPLLEQFQSEAKAFSGVTSFAGPAQLDLSGNGPAVMASGELVSGSYFSTLGVNAIIGRTLGPGDDAPSASPAVVLSYPYWQSAFGGERSALGRTIRLNNVPFEIVGVADPSFTNLTPGKTQDFWLPIAMSPRISIPWGGDLKSLDNWWVVLVARLQPGVPRGQAQAAASLIFRNQMLHGGKPLSKAEEDPSIILTPVQEGLSGGRGQISTVLYIMMGAVGFILLIACANVGGLLLSRAAARQKEMAVRLALGAARLRILRQLLTESMLLSAAAGALGILFAYWGVHAITAIVSRNLGKPFPYIVAPDWRVLLFTVSASVLTGILFGLAPALQSARLDLTPALKENASTALGGVNRARRWFNFGNALVIAQVAFSALVLVGAGLLVRTVQNLRNINPGFDTRNVLLFGINPTLIGEKDSQIQDLDRNLQQRLSVLPGVISASYSSGALLSGGLWTSTKHVEGQPEKASASLDMLATGPGFFQTMRIPVLEGRIFTAEDFEIAAKGDAARKAAELSKRSSTTRPPSESSAPAAPLIPVLVNATFARQYFPGANPLGKNLSEAVGDDPEAAAKANPPQWQIVGVVGDTKYNNLRRDIHPTVYVPQTGNGATFEVRTASDPTTIVAAVRDVVNRMDNNLPLFNVHTQSEKIDDLMSQERIVAQLASFFGILGLLLACVGLYGLLSFEVARRMREVGIRMALGAGRGDVLRLVVGKGFKLTALGVIAGMAGGLAVTRVLSSLLYGVEPSDPATFLAVSLLLIAVALAASYIPARRATKVDPMVALRYE